MEWVDIVASFFGIIKREIQYKKRYIVTDITKKILKHAMEQDKPVIIVYMGKEEMSQRRVYLRSMSEDKITAYCTHKKGLRVFLTQRILSAKLADE